MARNGTIPYLRNTDKTPTARCMIVPWTGFEPLALDVQVLTIINLHDSKNFKYVNNALKQMNALKMR